MLQFFIGYNQTIVRNNSSQFQFKYIFLVTILLLLTFTSQSIMAQSGEIYGVVKSENEEPMPYTNVVILGQAIGTSTNYDGEYSLKLKPGDYKVSFQFIGYKSEVREISIKAHDKIEINPILSVEKVLLNAVEVSAKAENPAYEIIRNAQENREKHLKENKEISYSIYTKLFGKSETNSASSINFFGTLLSPKKGIFYLSESVNKIYRHRYDKQTEVMEASLVLGDSANASQNNPTFIDLYRNRPISTGNQIVQNRIVSPIASDAFGFYDYDYLGTFEEEGQTIHKIKLIPRGTNRTVFRGEVYISENGWRVHQSHLKLKSSTGDAEINTQYIRDSETDSYLPFSSSFILKQEGSKTEIYFHNICYDYDLEGIPTEESEELNRKIDKTDYTKDPSWWESTRPIELTADEKNAYKIDRAINNNTWDFKKAENDSLYQNLVGDKKTTFFQKYQRAMNSGYWKLNDKFDLDVSIFTFNTVEGGVLKPELTFKDKFKNDHKYSAYASVRYGFASEDFYAKGAFSYELNPENISEIKVEGGSYVQQISGNPSISNYWNLFYTVFEKLNYQKLYQKDYISLKWKRELINGLDLQFGTSFNRRSPLQNNSTFNWYNEEEEARDFIPNQAFINGEYRDFEQSNLVEGNILLSYQPKRKFDLINGRKVPLSSKYPTFKTGFDFGTMDTEFSRIWANISDRWSINSVGFSDWSVSYGQFLNKSNLTPIDYFHFMGNRIFVYQSQKQYGLAYQLLEYYQYSDSDYFFGANFDHDFDGAILGRIPLLKKIGLKSYVLANYLQTSVSPQYVELGFGITSSFLPIRFNYVFSFENQDFVNSGFMINLNL
jgi:hypothetical protein